MARNNMFSVIGHLADDAAQFPNSDGSMTVKFKVAAPRTFTQADGQRVTDFIPCQKFLGAKTPDAIKQRFCGLQKGDAVTVTGMIKQNDHVSKKTGKMVYEFVCDVDDFEYDESKAAKQARQARKATAAA